MKSGLTNCVWKPRRRFTNDSLTVWRLQWSLVSCQLTSACDWWRAGHVTTTPASDWSAVAPGTLANVTCRLRCTETTVNLHTHHCLVFAGVTLATHLEIIYCLLVAEKAVIVYFLYKYLCFFSLEMVHMSEKLKD